MRTVAIVLSAALALGACAASVVREPPAPLVEFPSAYDVRQAWAADIGASSVKSYLRLVPAIRDGVIYAADGEGRVSAFEVASGQRKWSAELRAPVSGAVGVGDNLLLLGTRRGQVLALARETGAPVWNATVSSEVLAPPAVGEGIVAVQCIDGRVFALALADGKRLWSYERVEPALSLRGTDAPVITADAVVAGFASGKLVALRLKDGSVLWEATVGQPRGRNEIERLVDVDAAPLVLADAVYAASYQGKLVSLNPRGGAVQWTRDASSYTGIATDGDTLYLSDAKSHVLAFDRRTGSSLWKQEALRGRGLNAPVVYGAFVVVADYEGYVHWLARDDGRLLARYGIGSSPIRAPGVVDGETLFVAGASGTLTALRLTPK